MDLEPGGLDALKVWALNNDAIRELWLFGSRAKGTSHSDSDVDLALVLMPETDNTNWALAKYIQYAAAWKAQLETIVARPISFGVIEPGEKMFDEVTTTGERLWSRSDV